MMESLLFWNKEQHI